MKTHWERDTMVRPLWLFRMRPKASGQGQFGLSFKYHGNIHTTVFLTCISKRINVTSKEFSVMVLPVYTDKKPTVLPWFVSTKTPLGQLVRSHR